MEWPFVLLFSSSPLDFDSSPLRVPSLVRSISVTLRQIYFLQCASFGGVDRFDLEARFCFLQCAYFNRVDFFDPEARDYFLQWITFMTFRLRAFWKFWSQIVLYHVFVCASDPH